MSATKIMACKCKHEFQDKTYGKGKRVFNEAGSKTSTFYRCTACGSRTDKETKK